MRDLSFSLHDSRRERTSGRRKKKTPRANMLVLLLLTQKPYIQLQMHSPKLAARKSCSNLLLAHGRVSIPSLDFTRTSYTMIRSEFSVWFCVCKFVSTESFRLHLSWRACTHQRTARATRTNTSMLWLSRLRATRVFRYVFVFTRFQS